MSNTPNIRFKGFTASWEQRKLGEVFIQTSIIVNPKEDNVELWSLTVEDGLTQKTERYSRDFLVKKDDNFKEVRPGDIVYNPMNMTLGAVGYNGMDKSVAVSGYYTTMITQEGYDAYYINTWLKSPQAILLYKTYATGSLIEKQRVQFPTLSIIPVAFPGYEEQKKIGYIFENLDNLITLHQRKCDEMSELKKFMLQKMFPGNGEQFPEIRFSGFTTPWEPCKVGDITDRTYGGGTPKTSVEEYWDGEIPWVQSSNLSEHELFNVDIQRHITELGLQKSAAQLVPKNSIAVVSHVGVGKLVFMPFDYTTSQDFISLSELKTEPIFSCYALYKRLQDDLHIVQGSAIKGITKEDLLGKEITVPSEPEQRKIGVTMQNLDNLIILHQRKCNELKEIKKFMLQNMFPQKG